MGTNSAIEYVHHSWNPWMGCQPVSEGCDHCYMYAGMKRFGKDPRVVQRTKWATFNGPVTKGWAPGSRIFVCSWSDFFHPDADPWRGEAWGIIHNRPDLTFLIVTKRPEWLFEKLPGDWGHGWPNVWIIITAENQETFDNRIPWLLSTPAAVKGISYEPALGPIDISKCAGSIDWVAAGCESGPKRRHAETGWFRSLHDQCRDSRIPFFLKQMDVGGKLVKMPELYGAVYDQLPLASHGSS